MSEIINYDRVLHAAMNTHWGEHENGQVDWGARLLLHGPPGSKKTATMKALARRYRVPFYSLKPGAKGQGGFGVTPVPTKVTTPDGREMMVLIYPGPDWVASFGIGAAIVAVDEMNTAPPALQPPLLGLVQEKEIGSAWMGNRVRVIGATNSTEDAAGGWDLAPAVANRLGHIQWQDPTIEDWTDYMLRGATTDQKDFIDLVAEEQRVLEAWPNAFAAGAGLVTSFLRRNRSKFRQQPKKSDAQSSQAWASPRCYDDKTEVLTRRGFVSWPLVTEHDEFATRDNLGRMTFVRAAEIYKAPYKGQMYRIKGQHVDQLITPGHKVLVSLGHRSTSEQATEFRLMPIEGVADYLHGTRVARMTSEGAWSGTDNATFTIGDRRVSSCDLARFLGWWLTDGSLQRNQNGQTLVKVTQVDDALRDDVFEAFSRVSTKKVWMCKDRVIVDDPALFEFLVEQGPKHAGKRFVPRALMDCDKETMSALLEGAFVGGWLNKGTKYICVGSNKRLASDLQEAAIKSGGTGRVTCRRTRKGTEIYTVSIMVRRYINPIIMADNVSKEDYDGTIYCCRVEPHHTLLIRRNGHAIWSGNTWEYAIRTLASSRIHGLNDSETDLFMGAYVGEAVMVEFAAFRSMADLPDPMALLEGREKFKHNPHRLDRTMVTINSCAAIVAPEKAEHRKERAKFLWLILTDLLQEAEDVAIPVASTLFKAGLSGSKESTPVLAKLKSILMATVKV